MGHSDEVPGCERQAGSVSRMRLRRFSTLALVVYWAALFCATHIPDPDQLVDTDFSDKTLHFLAYFGLYVLLSGQRILSGRRRLAAGEHARLLAIGAGYAVVDELLQALPFIRRHCDPYDVVADCTGLALAAILVSIVQACVARRQFGAD